MFEDDVIAAGTKIVQEAKELGGRFKEGGLEFKTSLQKLAKDAADGGGEVKRALGRVGAAFQGVENLILAPLKLGVGVVVTVLRGFAAAVKISIQAATEQARALASIRANTGLGFKEGFALTSRNSLFGISPADSAQMYSGAGMNPFVAGIRGRATGFGSPYDPDYLQNAAQRYQSYGSSPLGRLMANQALDQSYGGQAPESIRETLNLQPAQIQRQIDYGQNIQSRLGVSGDDLKQYAEEVPLAAQRIAYAVNLIKLKLAVELAPAIEKGLGAVADFIAKNAGKIGKAIETGVHYLIHDFPPALLRGAASVLRGASLILGGIGAFATGLAGNVKPLLGVFDAIINAVRALAAGLAGGVAFIIQTVGNLWDGLQKTGIPQLMQKLGSQLTGLPNDSPENQIANSVTGGAAVKTVAPVVTSAAGDIVKKAIAKRIAAKAATTATTVVEDAAVVTGTEGAAAVGGGLLATVGSVFNPIARGVAAGYLLDRGLAHFGILNPNQSFLDRQRRAIGVIGDFLTRNPGHYDAESDRQEAAAANLAAGGLTPDQLRNKSQAEALLKKHPDFAQNYAKYGYSADEAQKVLANAGLQTVGQASAQGGASGLKAAFSYTPGLDPSVAFTNGQNAVYGTFAESNLANNPDLQSSLSKLFGNIGDSATSKSKTLSDWADKALSMANNYTVKLDEDSKSKLAEIAKNTGKDGNEDLARMLGEIMLRFGSRVMADISEDNALNQLHI